MTFFLFSFDKSFFSTVNSKKSLPFKLLFILMGGVLIGPMSDVLALCNNRGTQGIHSLNKNTGR